MNKLLSPPFVPGSIIILHNVSLGKAVPGKFNLALTEAPQCDNELILPEVDSLSIFFLTVIHGPEYL